MAEIRRIDTPEVLEQVLESARSQPVWIFKHSLTCSISTAAWREFQAFAAEQGERSGSTLLTMVPIQEARPVSKAVAEHTGVRHASPQALLLQGSEVLWHGSHWDIDRTALSRAHDTATRE